jgi:alpha-1,2-mannosyltransferase
VGRRIFTVAAWAIGALCLISIAPEVLHRVGGKPWDGLVDWYAARAWWQGEDPYTLKWLREVGSEGLGHPPTTSFYALPFALLPLSFMSPILGALVLSVVFAELWQLGEDLAFPSPLALAVLVLGVLLNAPFMLYHLGIAQISALIGLLYFLAWRALRRGRDLPAGIALGYACTIKLFPGVMVLFLLLTRRWRAVAAAAATWLAVAAVMTARFGVDAWFEFSASEKRIVDYWIGHASNASIQGIMLRIFHPGCEGQWPSDPRASLLAAAVSVLLLGVAAGLWLSRRNFDLSFGLFALLSLFSNPFYFEHYNVILILPAALAAAALWRTPLRRWERLFGLVLLAGALGCLEVPINSARVLFAWSVKNPDFHLRAHLVEIQTALPTPLLMLLSAWLAYKTPRPTSASAAAPDTP